MLIVTMFFTVEWVNHSKEFQKGQGFTNVISLILCFIFFIEWPEYRNWIRLGATALPLLLNSWILNISPKRKETQGIEHSGNIFVVFPRSFGEFTPSFFLDHFILQSGRVIQTITLLVI
jgi:hypothetical protein